MKVENRQKATKKTPSKGENQRKDNRSSQTEVQGFLTKGLIVGGFTAGKV